MTTRFESDQAIGLLTPELKRSWLNDGYIVLQGLHAEAQTAAIDAVIGRIWDEKPNEVVVDDMNAGRRMRMSAVASARDSHRLKINDVYLSSEDMRAAILCEPLVQVLRTLLRHEPVLCNTLNIDRGTEQPRHVDTLYMTPRSDDHLIAAWVALEDASPQSGPLFYYPGSHQIPPFRFSNGSQHVISGEFPQWESFADRHIAERGLERQTFLAKRGDVFVWHARLIHGGSPITDPHASRKSLVCHFYSEEDCEHLEGTVLPCASGMWLNRPPQRVL